MSTTNEMYEKATQALIGMLEEGRKAKFEKPWNIKQPQNAVSGHIYSGVNTLILGTSESASGLWASFKQWKSIKAQVRKGEKSTSIFFYDRKVKEVDNGDGSTEDKVIFICKKWHVFSAEQVDGYEIPKDRLSDVEEEEKERLETAETFFLNTEAKLTENLDRAFYSPSGDYIGMPRFEQFKTSSSYYSTLFHEVTHWTGHATRCARKFGSKFGDTDYAKEELVAELGAIFTSLRLNSLPMPSLNSASYIVSWLGALKDDTKYVTDASRLAKKALDFTFSLQLEAEEKVA